MCNKDNETLLNDGIISESNKEFYPDTCTEEVEKSNEVQNALFTALNISLPWQVKWKNIDDLAEQAMVKIYQASDKIGKSVTLALTAAGNNTKQDIMTFSIFLCSKSKIEESRKLQKASEAITIQEKIKTAAQS